MEFAIRLLNVRPTEVTVSHLPFKYGEEISMVLVLLCRISYMYVTIRFKANQHWK